MVSFLFGLASFGFITLCVKVAGNMNSVNFVASGVP